MSKDTWNALKQNPDISSVSAERIREEFPCPQDWLYFPNEAENVFVWYAIFKLDDSNHVT